MSDIVSAEQLKIISITMDSERFSEPLILSNASDSGVVVEFNIYENLTLGYLTGNIILQDDQDIFTRADINGTERIILEFVVPDQTTNSIIKTFVVKEITDSVKSNDYSSILSLSLVEDIKFYNDLNKFSKAYTGTGEQIIENIVKDKLGRELIIESKIESTQASFRYIVPYQDPLTAIKTVLSKMTTDNGYPFFFYSSIVDDNFYLTDLETIINTQSFNHMKPFIYDQENINKNDIESQSTNITHFESGLLENTLNLALAGGMGSQYESINATTGINFIYHQDMNRHFSKLIEAELLPKDQNFIAFDSKFISDPKKIDQSKITDFNSKIHTRVVTNPYDDANGFDQEYDEVNETFKLTKRSVIAHLLKNKYNINVPGILFSINNIETCVGHQISMIVYKNDISHVVGGRIDDKRSGRFIIIAKRHCLNVAAGSHNVSLDLCKLAGRSISNE
jgi:hypothetical protein|tara:strand:+ start:6571 stop:7926 length:1356 start_codon:yes stop_codon:yes gene_type:complete